MQVVYLTSNINEAHAFYEIGGENSVECFLNHRDLFNFLQNNDADLVFFEPVSENADPFYVCKELKKQGKEIRSVLVAPSGEYAEEAFENELFGYVIKPCTLEKLQAITNRYKRKNNNCRVKVKTFGRFDVFVSGQAIHFSNKKAKELMALLIDRFGGFVTMDQAIDVLWEDRAYDECTKALYRIALKNLRDTLSSAGCADILIEKRGQRRIDKEKVSCDYFDFLDDPQKNGWLFDDEYMMDYSWSELTLAKIVKIYEKNCN